MDLYKRFIFNCYGLLKLDRVADQWRLYMKICISIYCLGFHPVPQVLPYELVNASFSASF